MTSQSMRRSLSSRLADEGITIRQWEVLAWLACDSEISQGSLAECLGIEPHTLAGVLRRMEAGGWLTRESCTKDRRRNKLAPTPKAEEVWNRAREICMEVRAKAIAGFSKVELDQLKSLCARIRENLQSTVETPEMPTSCEPQVITARAHP